MYNTTNDVVLTKQRQEEIAKNGVPQGFPVWVIRNRHNSILGMFAGKQNAEAKLEELQHYMWCKLDLLFIEDVSHVSYELN